MIYVLTKFKPEYKMNNFPELVFASTSKEIVEIKRKELEEPVLRLQEISEEFSKAIAALEKTLPPLPEYKDCLSLKDYHNKYAQSIEFYREKKDNLVNSYNEFHNLSKEESEQMQYNIAITFNIVEVESD